MCWKCLQLCLRKYKYVAGDTASIAETVGVARRLQCSMQAGGWRLKEQGELL